MLTQSSMVYVCIHIQAHTGVQGLSLGMLPGYVNRVLPCMWVFLSRVLPCMCVFLSRVLPGMC